MNVGNDRIIDLGLKNLEDLAIGYTLSGDAGYQIAVGASGGGNITKVMFFNKEFGFYWYSYAGGQVTARGGLGAQISASGTLGIFAMKNVGFKKDRFNPIQFEGPSKTYSLEGVFKAGGGLGASLSYFDAGIWKGWGIGVSAGVGFGGQLGGAFTLGYSKLITPAIKTSKRSWSDIILNNINH